MQNLSAIAEQMIQYEKQHNLTDNEMAFGSQISVERIHNIKSGEAAPSPEETQLLAKFMKAK